MNYSSQYSHATLEKTKHHTKFKFVRRKENEIPTNEVEDRRKWRIATTGCGRDGLKL